MPTPTKGRRLGGSPAHQRLILANLATNLFEHGRITTTEAKARRLRPFAERLITKARHDDLHNRRQVLTVIRDKSVLHTLFTEIGPRFATRPGGYTRITKVGPRKGDNAPMAVIELVEAREFASQDATAAPPRPAASAAEAPASDAGASSAHAAEDDVSPGAGGDAPPPDDAAVESSDPPAEAEPEPASVEPEEAQSPT